jgi:hypothetical protein
MAASESDRLWQSAVAATGDTRKYEREILVTLQPTGGKRHIWEALSEEIHSSPDTWRWWIRRHPASTNQQDQEYSKLVGNGRAAVIAGKACQVPLPALLAHMDAQVSLASGAACEAVMLGVPAYFIDQEARDTFPQLLSRGEAELVDVRALSAAIERARPRIGANGADVRDLERTLEVIDRRAFDYSRLCAETAYDKIDCGVRIVGQSQMPSAC